MPKFPTHKILLVGSDGKMARVMLDPPTHIDYNYSNDKKATFATNFKFVPEDQPYIQPDDITDDSQIKLDKMTHRALKMSEKKYGITNSAITYKKLFLDVASKLLRNEGINANLYNMVKYHVVKNQAAFPIADSQSLLLRHDFIQLPIKELPGQVNISGNESTTSYKFTFGFTRDLPIEGVENLVMQPIFLIDNDALLEIENSLIYEAPKYIKEFSAGFIKMAGIAEHDYIHTITIPYGEGLPNMFEDDDNYYRSGLEKHALSTHAQILAELFNENPKRKERILQQVIRDLDIISNIQQKMIEDGNIAKANEVGTYLTEICCHRLFRIISPEDPDLNKALSYKKFNINGKEYQAQSSVCDMLKSITILVPEQFKNRGPDNPDNLDKVLINLTCMSEKFYGHEPYSDIHKHNINMVDFGEGVVSMTNMQVLGKCHKNYIKQNPYETHKAHKDVSNALDEVYKSRLAYKLDRKDLGAKNTLFEAKKNYREAVSKHSNIPEQYR